MVSSFKNMYFSCKDHQWETVIIPEEEVDLYSLEGTGTQKCDLLLHSSLDFQMD